jgi:hypothetical protein
MAEHTKLQEGHVDQDTTEKPAITKRSAREQSTLVRSKAPSPAPDESAPGYGFLFEAPVFTSWFRGVGILSGEMTRFIQDRLSEDMTAWSVLASCRTPEEAFECQRRFAEKATAQYAEEITKLSQLMLDLATEGLQSFCAKPNR